jgi:3-hydroxyacyl-CoA dehydrogenase
MPVSPAERGMLEQIFDEVLTDPTLNTALTVAQKMVEQSIIDKEDVRSFIVGFLSGAFLTEGSRLATTPEKLVEIADECSNILLRRAWEIRDRILNMK